LLGLPYPGGPSIQVAAQGGDPHIFNFPRARLDNDFDFSFSGLKTAVLREVQKYKGEGRELPVADMAASFQAAVIETLFEKSVRAAEAHHVKEILVAGGVSANQALRQAFLAQDRFTVHIPPLPLCTDNAAMVASAGYYRFALGHRDGLGFDAMPNWPLSSLGA